MSYLIADPSEIGKRKYHIVDMPRFGHDLAAALGWSIVIERENSIRITAPDEKLSLHLYNETWSPSKATRVGVTCSLPDVPPGDRPSVGHDAKYALPGITVSADRDMDAIVRDVRKRIIDASSAPAADIRAWAAERHAQRHALAEHIATMETTHGTNIRFNKDRMDNYTCSFSWYQNRANPNSSTFGNFYVDGRLNADGSINIDRVRSVDMAALDALIHAMVK